MGGLSFGLRSRLGFGVRGRERDVEFGRGGTSEAGESAEGRSEFG